RIDERRERVRLLEDPDQTEPLDPEAEAGLELDHLHERFFLFLAVSGEALSGTAAQDEELHAEVTEDGVARSLGHGGLGARLRLVQLGKNLFGSVADLLAFLVHLRLVGGQGGCGRHEHDRENREADRGGFHCDVLLSIWLWSAITSRAWSRRLAMTRHHTTEAPRGFRADHGYASNRLPRLRQ